MDTINFNVDGKKIAEIQITTKEDNQMRSIYSYSLLDYETSKGGIITTGDIKALNGIGILRLAGKIIDDLKTKV